MVANPSPPNIDFQYLNTILLTDPTGTPTTGLDADNSGHKTIPTFPDLPNAIYTGDGFGGAGSGSNRVTIDSEGIVVNNDGTFWLSDEYGPYIYRFGPAGNMIQAIQPPLAFIPMRNGSESFSSDNPPIYANETDDVIPADVDSGRVNNHGFEGLTTSPDGKNLYVLLQAATHQDGGESKSTERYTRLLQYSINGLQATYTAEYVVPLPTYPSGKKPNVAAQSEMHYISPTQFLVLARDSKAGQGQSSTTSVYRHADVFDISGATNIKGITYDCATCTVAPAGVLKAGITPATYCSFLDYNINSQLNRFGVHNGGAQDSSLLNEKWESFALVPVNGNGSDGEYFLFSMSDNDFITQNGKSSFSWVSEASSTNCFRVLRFRKRQVRGCLWLQFEQSDVGVPDHSTSGLCAILSVRLLYSSARHERKGAQSGRLSQQNSQMNNTYLQNSHVVSSEVPDLPCTLFRPVIACQSLLRAAG